MPLQNQYPDAFKTLETLYKPEEAEAERAALDETFAYTEGLWQKYLEMIPNKQVKYLMIGEAAPCGEHAELPYIFNPNAQPKKVTTAIVTAFFGSPIYKEVGMAETLRQLAERGFLAIDPIPFAMPYSKGGKRGRKGYATLLGQTAQTYFLDKLNDSGIRWDADLRVAFYLRKTAMILMAQFPEGLTLNGLRAPVMLSEEMVAINGANYPDAGVLRGVYGLG